MGVEGGKPGICPYPEFKKWKVKILEEKGIPNINNIN
jgi:hypothetical protein